jgi:hypothetical protein
MMKKEKREPASTLTNPNLAYFMLHDTTVGSPIRRIFLDTSHRESVIVKERPTQGANGIMQAEAVNEAGETEVYQLTRDENNYPYWVLATILTFE